MSAPNTSRLRADLAERVEVVATEYAKAAGAIGRFAQAVRRTEPSAHLAEEAGVYLDLGKKLDAVLMEYEDFVQR